MIIRIRAAVATSQRVGGISEAASSLGQSQIDRAIVAAPYLISARATRIGSEMFGWTLKLSELGSMEKSEVEGSESAIPKGEAALA